MAPRPIVVASACVLVMSVGAPGAVAAQASLAPVHASGQSVTPVFEGWYKNPDGSFSISFGYFNRNATEVVEVPIGAENTITPGPANQGQPTSFQPRRNWGVFAVRVPADFGRQKVTWTLKDHGETFSIAGSLNPLWEIDALEGEAGSGNTPPGVKFDERGPEARGPAGITAGPLTAKLGTPLAVTVWARDDGRAAPNIATAGRGEIPVTLAWFKHQGPGDVTFAPPTARVPNAGGQASTNATFTKPGEYILRVRANDASGITGAGHAQCCWTNGFVRVIVTP